MFKLNILASILLLFFLSNIAYASDNTKVSVKNEIEQGLNNYQAIVIEFNKKMDADSYGSFSEGSEYSNDRDRLHESYENDYLPALDKLVEYVCDKRDKEILELFFKVEREMSGSADESRFNVLADILYCEPEIVRDTYNKIKDARLRKSALDFIEFSMDILMKEKPDNEKVLKAKNMVKKLSDSK